MVIVSFIYFLPHPHPFRYSLPLFPLKDKSQYIWCHKKEMKTLDFIFIYFSWPFSFVGSFVDVLFVFREIKDS